MALASGTRLGAYEILAPLGAGGMGEVYKALDTRLDRQVAVKVLPDQVASDPERLARFEREARVLAALNHPNIAQIYGVEQSGSASTRALVIELVPGEPVKGPLPLATALDYARQVADALEAAHEKGIVHRDLKPDNILVTAGGVVKVLDFGLASVESRTQDKTDPRNSPTLTTSPTRTGMIMGTAAYMSPEQARGKPADRRADIWAFGAVLYEMITGRPLFEGETVSDILVEILSKEPDLSALPAHPRAIVERCLRRDPRRRWQAIGDVRIAIEEDAPESGAPAPAVAAGRRAMLPWALAGAFLLVAVAASFIAWRSAHSSAGDHPLIRLDADLGPEARVSGTYAAFVAAISPDGTRLVYPVRGPDGKQMLASRVLNTPNSAVIAGTEYGADPFFSPDSQSIGFFADGKLKKIALNGGAPVILADAFNPRGASWGEDGNIIAALSNNRGLFRVSASGGETPQPVTKLAPGEVTHRWPQVLPGGQGVLFTASRNLSDYEDAVLEVQIFKSGERKVLAQGGYFGRYAASGHLLYIHAGSLFAMPMNASTLTPRGSPVTVLSDVASSSTSAAGEFDVSSTGLFVYQSGKERAEIWSIAALDATGGSAPQPQLSKGAAYFTPRYSPDGRRLALAIEGKGLDVYSYDFRKDVLSRLTFMGELTYNPGWAPDGNHIVAQSAARGTETLLWMRADGAGGQQKLLEANAQLQPHSFSPDGRWLAFQQGDETNFDISVLPLDLTDPDHPRPGNPQPFAQTPANEVQPAFSPDGRWLAYASDETGAYEVYVRPFPATSSAGKWQVSSGGGKMPVWSRDGRNLFFESLDSHIMLCGYTVNGASFSAARPHLWSEKQLASPTDDRNFDVSPDGKRIEALLPPQSADDNKTPLHVTFLINFFDELRRRTQAIQK
jgi:Tol biopolymer transport system component